MATIDSRQRDLVIDVLSASNKRLAAMLRLYLSEHQGAAPYPCKCSTCLDTIALLKDTNPVNSAKVVDKDYGH